jgi:RHH-type proline utilization regulon transcriptional repressor/proline dehydrogenase/delta 1-pyrroline-5-carboxylate dehydrogenase
MMAGMGFVFDAPPAPKREALAAILQRSEAQVVDALLLAYPLDGAMRARVEGRARRIVEEMRRSRASMGGLDAFLKEFSLSSREGVVLMCLAEALLRIPDADTADRLIRDKLGEGDWAAHLGQSKSLFVNASTWALMLTGRVVRLEDSKADGLRALLGRMVAISGEPLIRRAVMAAMRILGRQFVMGRTIDEALERAAPAEPKGWRHSYDMLGEAARSREDARRYFDAYLNAIQAIGRASSGRGPIDGPGISVKLSALHARYEVAQAERVRRELRPMLLELARAAKAADIGLTVDAEEAERLDLSLDLIEAALDDPALSGWDGFGLAIQAYATRTHALIGWLAEAAASRRRRIMVRLVKGAYWDSEIKRAQERGLAHYPVFTRKASTDVSYLVCARELLLAERIYPQFATHNAHTLAAVEQLAGNRPFEFQRLHGMGEELYEQLVTPQRPCRVYAPVGSHEDLLPYLVRRLLENGANTSFVNRIADDAAPIADIIADPSALVSGYVSVPHPRIPVPPSLYGSERRNAAGLDLNDLSSLTRLKTEMDAAMRHSWSAVPVVDGKGRGGAERKMLDPADRRRVIGTVAETRADDVALAVKLASAAQPDWDRTPADIRAGALDRAGDLLEQHRGELMALIVREGGRTVPDALSELREAVDFCRFYAAQAREHFRGPRLLPGPTGGTNELFMHGRGVFACISPWNFPVAIFTGQVTAALAAGNAVIAKPAEQTPLAAARVIALLHESGVPGDVLHFLPGDGRIGAALTAHPGVAGVAFTGSTETAQAIARSLAARNAPLAALIAETGGLNAMIVDSSALIEQVVGDSILSAFNSAGQRCSALRVLFVQDDVADRLLAVLRGAMEELVIGDPGLLATDVGPVIDEAARSMLDAHWQAIRRVGRVISECKLPPACEHGTFFAPRAVEIDSLSHLTREVFGPILHVVRFDADQLDTLVDNINATGYGLTLGVHSRIDETIERVTARARVGNIYVNRNMIGAVVGVQPFGGEGLSGTGPKAGGPHYLHRFATERCVATDTTAQGGNASLLTLGADQ